MKLGIDFGTTNSAIAAVDAHGAAQLLNLFPGEPVQRSVMYAAPNRVLHYGNAAFDAYLAEDLAGRFLRSMKAFLSHDMPPTQVGSRRRKLPEIVALYIRFLMRRAEKVTGQKASEIVVGRPVRFHQDPARDQQAASQLQAALELAGLPDVRMQLEPVAAARRYEATLDRERVLLVGDFGGGTADFAVLRVGPERDRSDPQSGVLSTTGVAQAGDAFDGCFMDGFLLPWFGRGVPYTPPDSDVAEPWNPTVLHRVQRLFYIPMLREKDLAAQLDRVEPRVADAAPIRRLRRLVFDDLGFPLAWSIEATKKALSSSEDAEFSFSEFYNESLDFSCDVNLTDYAAASERVLAAYRSAIDAAVENAGMTRDDIDEIFLTGGTSQLPFVRQVFVDMFGAERLREADALTSVCEGLALS